MKNMQVTKIKQLAKKTALGLQTSMVFKKATNSGLLLMFNY